MNDKELQDKLEGLFSGLELEEEPTMAGEPGDPSPLPPPAPAERAGTRRGLTAPVLVQPTAPPEPHLAPAPEQPYQASAAASVPLGVARGRVKWRLIIWGVLLTLAGILLVAYGQALFFNDGTAQPGADPAQPGFVLPLSPTPTATPPARPSPPAGQSITLVEPTATITPWPGGRIVVLTPAANTVGWVVSREAEESLFPPPNHFGDSFMYAGTANGRIYHAACQFKLDQIPRGSRIHAASLRLTGLRADQLAAAGGPGQGRWQVQLLAPAGDYHWPGQTYRQLHQAELWTTLQPALTPAELGAGRENWFEFSPEQLKLLERRLLQGSDRFGQPVSFRIDGPPAGSAGAGAANLFAWDSGHGSASQGAGPQLFLSVGPPPAETPPPYYVIITSTPTPDNISTAVAISARLTAEATRIGTATPVPPYWVTPIVVTATPTAQNQATARAMRDLATAIARTTGQPLTVATATPSPTYVVITSTPTPLSIETAVAQAWQATAAATRLGTATALPSNWVTPLVVTSTPVPENRATADYWQAVSLTTGTPTPLPANAQTATPTPVSVAVEPLLSPTATATPSPTPQALPAGLLGKILFLSDREGATEEERARAAQRQATPQVTPQPYVYDPATGQLERLTARWPYDVAVAREGWSADTAYQAYTKQLLWTNVNGHPTEELAIHYYDYEYGVEQIVTRMGAGIVYDPAWSPVSDEIAFVATESGNDEVWLINRDGSAPRQLTRNQWEWDKHPSWSPDGQQIVFFSNRTGANQLWIMNKDGTDQRLLMPANPYNDFDPVWVKWLQPAPALERQPDWRFVKPQD